MEEERRGEEQAEALIGTYSPPEREVGVIVMKIDSSLSRRVDGGGGFPFLLSEILKKRSSSRW